MARLLFKDEEGTLHEVYGSKGPRGYSISDISLNENYELVVTTEDGRTYISPSIRGAQGPAGRPGADGGENNGTVILELINTNNNFPVTFRSNVPQVGETEALESLAFSDMTYNPDSKTLNVGNVNAIVSDSRSAILDGQTGNLVSGEPLRVMFGKIKTVLAKIQSHAQMPLATGFTSAASNIAAAASLTYQLKQLVDRKAALGHTHTSSDISDVIPVEKGGTGQTSVDTAPITGSAKMITSGGVKTALEYKADLNHAHNASEITSGTLEVARGGTGQSSLDAVVVGEAAAAQKLKTARQLMTNLGATSATTFDGSANTNINVTGTLGTGNGGTGQTTLTPAIGTHAARAIYAGTGAMTSGSSSLTTGKIYLQYE